MIGKLNSIRERYKGKAETVGLSDECLKLFESDAGLKSAIDLAEGVAQSWHKEFPEDFEKDVV